ncbi:immunity 8 family protein [Tahibacter sp.]|uniref:immunity 8 family protein n=1 Tax=Tahibacter sp. TaxID=2056211 RepID=UPI0028C435DF|nr:immunity 8 family protein [Tahibacter sp.]
MKAELKWLESPDVDLNTFEPERPDCFGFLLQAGIGPAGSNAADTFDLQVCTPAWLVDRHRNDGAPPFLFGTNLMIVFAYDLGVIRGALQHHCEGVTGANWDELAARLSRIAAWEFDGYR